MYWETCEQMKRVVPVIKNKYFIATVLFLAWLTFFDKNDFFSQYEYRQKLKDQENDKKYYLDEIQKNRKDMNELMTNPKNLEKFAREKYLMKKDNEDIFVILQKDSVKPTE